MVITVSSTTLVYQQRYSLVVQVRHASCMVVQSYALYVDVVHYDKLWDLSCI